MKSIFILFFSIGLLVASQSCFAEKSAAVQPSPEKQVVKKADLKPTVITSDGGLALDYNKNTAVFKQNVIVKDEQGTMKADEMKIYFSPKGSTVSKIEAFGNVFIDHGDRKAEGQKVEMFIAEGRMVLTGNPKIKQGADIYSAEKITIFKDSNQIIFEPNAKLVIYQDNKGDIF